MGDDPSLADLKDRLGALDAKLRIIGQRPVDISDPNWQEKLKRIDPLGGAGAREEAKDVFDTLTRLYANGPNEERLEIPAKNAQGE